MDITGGLLHVVLLLLWILGALSYDNIALNKSASQSSSHDKLAIDPPPASRANDGDGTNVASMIDNSCIHTKEGETQAWWRVDLGDIHWIDQVYIKYRDWNHWNMDKSREAGVYLKADMPTNPKEWKLWKQKRKAEKRKWKEERLLKKLEKEQKSQKIEKTDTEDPKKSEKNGVGFTISIALPGSILDNAQSPELRTYLAGQIARAAVIFRVDEIIIFDETGSTDRSIEGEFQGVGKKGQANIQMARILQYLECPQYLRKSFFPQHKDLQYAGILNPLDTPHHMRSTEETEYREGVVLDKPVKPGKGSFVNVGLPKQEVQIDRQLQAGLRVTVKMAEYSTEKKKLKGMVVPPSAPGAESSVYWGYNVRLAPSLGTVLTECPYKGGYDLTIGTSERGDSVDTFTPTTEFNHALVVFGGVQGLEASLEVDEGLEVEDPSLLFQHYLNTCPDQGSRTIRTEEAILLTLSALRPKLQKADKE